MDAQGTFVAMNNVVSQSVPHLHVHVVPRRRKDGLRGFFWPRTRYEDDAAMAAVAAGSPPGSTPRLPRADGRTPPPRTAARPRRQRTVRHGLRERRSSIYYALGLVAGLALGLTPFVFVITGVFFFCTAATYAEATAMFPEAGGLVELRAPRRSTSSSRSSRLGADAQLHHHGRHLGVLRPPLPGGLFWEPLRSAPGDIIFGAGVIAFLSLVNVVGVKESAGLNVLLAVVDFLTQVLLVLVGSSWSSRPTSWSPTWTSAWRRRGRSSCWRSRSG
jgi:hypothetical protein